MAALFKIALAISLLVAATTVQRATAAGLIPTPPSALNRYCGGHIYNGVAYPTCSYLAQSDVVPHTSVGQSETTVFMTIYPSPPLIPITGTTTLADPNTAVNFANYGYDTSVASQPARFPDTITFPMPYCALRGVELASDSYVNTPLEYWSTDGTSRVPVRVTPNHNCYSVAYVNYEPICSADPTTSFDMHCTTESTSFYECAQNQPLLQTSTMQTGYGAPVNTTAWLAYELDQAADSFETVPGKCATAGTKYFGRYVGNVTTNGRTLIFPSTRGTGLPTRDMNGEYIATVTFKADHACLATYGVTNVTFMAEGVFAQTEPAAAPVRIRWIDGDVRTERTVYMPGLRCSPAAPRPAESDTQSSRFDVEVSPYCITTYPAGPPDPLGPIALADSGGIIPPITPDGSTIPRSRTVYISYTRDLLSTTHSVWMSTRLIRGSDVSVSAAQYQLFRGEYTLIMHQNDYILEIRTPSPSSPWRRIGSPAALRGLPFCQCARPDIEGVSGTYAALPCGADNRILASRPGDGIVYINPMRDTLVYTYNSVTPTCSIYLTNGYQGRSDSALQNSAYAINAVVYPAYSGDATHRWEVVAGGTSTTVVFTGGATVSPTTVRFGSISGVVQLKYTMSYPSTYAGVLAVGSCTLDVTVYRGLPVAIVTPGKVTAGIATPVLINATDSYSTTSESITFGWNIILPADGSGASLTQTGNSPTTIFVATDPGTYSVSVTVATPRNSVVAVVSIVIVETVAGNPSTNQTSNCVTSIGNAGIGDPVLPPFDNSEWVQVKPQPPEAPLELYVPDPVPVEPPFNLSEPVYAAIVVPLVIVGSLAAIVLIALMANARLWCCPQRGVLIA